MGRFREAAAAADDETKVDMSPLIDCVFILLIFFIVTTTFVEESGIALDKPQPATAAQSDAPSFVVELTATGKILHEGQEIGIGGVRQVARAAMQSGESPLVVQADAEASSGLMMRVVDEAKLAGADKVSVATRRKRD